jgi:hemoglobin-like flavoprotein
MTLEMRVILFSPTEATMKLEHVQLVQETFEQVRPIAETAAALFYGRLFELDPSLRHLFHGDMKQQGAKLMATLALAVNGLSQPETILPAVKHLGRKHAGYGVRDEHYATVGAALLWTLEQGLGEAFTPEVKAAWTEAYMLLAGVMQEAAAQASALAPTQVPALAAA